MSCVLDASALLARIQREPGMDRVAEVLETAFMSTVNLSEAIAKLVERGIDYAHTQEQLAASGLTLVGFEPADAYAAADMRKQTRALGLSFGDRACLTLARRLGLPALTTDRAWARLDLGIAIEVIR